MTILNPTWKEEEEKKISGEVVGANCNEGNLIRRRSSKTQEGTATGGGGGVADINCVFQLVKSMLENSESEEQTDRNDDEDDTHAQTANSCPTTHLS